MNKDHQILWELQVVRFTASGEEHIILRELYPDRDSLYERARDLRAEMAQGSVP
jgi:hypothetical protein